MLRLGGPCPLPAILGWSQLVAESGEEIIWGGGGPLAGEGTGTLSCFMAGTFIPISSDINIPLLHSGFA